ncbi:MAG: hypothetical protein H7A52_05180 [Akkermansiaceae bacterium]|nr:hypothetical protein [Akkermansiaceae bacterium]
MSERADRAAARLAAVFAMLLPLAASGEAQEPGDRHTFTGANGQTLEAEVLDFRDAKVVIRRLADGQVFELPANRLSPPDVDFMRAWLKEREAAAHPAGWKRLRIHLPGFADKLEAPGIPEAFRRIDLRTWEAELPEGAWVLARLWTASGEGEPVEFLLRHGGEREWFLRFEDARLYRSGSAQERGALAGIHIRAGDGDAELKSMKAEIPDGGVALFSGFLDAADLSNLGADRVLSFVSGKVEDFSLLGGKKVRAARVTTAPASFEGLSGADDLECLDVKTSGDFPLAIVSKLKSLKTLIVSGDATLSGGSGGWPALRHLSLAPAEIEDPDALAEFLGRMPELESLELPDFTELNIAGLAQCPKLTALALGDDCHDPDAAGLGALENLTTVLLNARHGASEIAGLAAAGRFAKVRVFRTGVSCDFARLPRLRVLLLHGSRDEFEPGALAALAGPVELRLLSSTADDLAALAKVAPEMKVRFLTARFPNAETLDSLAAFAGLEILTLEDQLLTFENKLTAVDPGKFPALRGFEMARMQNLAGVTLSPASKLEAFAAVACDALETVAAPAAVPETVLIRCGALRSTGGLVDASGRSLVFECPRLK